MVEAPQERPASAATRCRGGRSPRRVNSSERAGGEDGRADAGRGGRRQRDQHDARGQRQRRGAEVQPAAQPRLDLGDVISAHVRRQVVETCADRWIADCVHAPKLPGRRSRVYAREPLNGHVDRARASRRYHRRVADWKRGLRRVLYPAYEARVVAGCRPTGSRSTSA